LNPAKRERRRDEGEQQKEHREGKETLATERSAERVDEGEGAAERAAEENQQRRVAWAVADGQRRKRS
jgi:hypothetical protein